MAKTIVRVVLVDDVEVLEAETNKVIQEAEQEGYTVKSVTCNTTSDSATVVLENNPTTAAMEDFMVMLCGAAKEALSEVMGELGIGMDDIRSQFGLSSNPVSVEPTATTENESYDVLNDLDEDEAFACALLKAVTGASDDDLREVVIASRAEKARKLN